MTINKITFLESIIPNDIFCLNNSMINRLYFFDSLEITIFLDTLEVDKVYVVCFEYISSWNLHDEDSPVITLSKPILITRNSNPRIISNFIKSQIDLACLSYTIEQIDNMYDKTETPGVLIKYREINIF
jgi:hypothetical protein